MALVKDLIVQGNARFLNDAFFAIIKSGTWNGSPIDLTHGGTAGETTAGKVLVSTATSGTSEWKLQSALSVGSATTATTATYASNVGASGTAGTNYVTAAKVIATCNWYDTMTGSDTDTVINRWSEIVAFVANFTETPDLATYLANNYLAITGNSTSKPMTGTIYVKDVSPIYLHSTNLDLDVWRVSGNTNSIFDNNFGFYLRYKGSGSGDDNSLSLWANNQNNASDAEVYRVQQSGLLKFLQTPKVVVNGTDVAVSLTTHTHAFSDLTSHPTTLAGYGITDAAPSVDGGYLPLSGGTMTGAIKWQSSLTDKAGGWNISGSSQGLFILTHTSESVTGSPDRYSVGIHVGGYYNMQIATCALSNKQHLYWRYPTSEGTAWKTLLDSTNYTSYTTKKDGTGATGTWPISITGNADTVDNKHASDFAEATHNHDGVYSKEKSLTPPNDYIDFVILLCSLENTSSTQYADIYCGGTIFLKRHNVFSGLMQKIDFFVGKNSAEATPTFCNVQASGGLGVQLITCTYNSKPYAAFYIKVDSSKYAWGKFLGVSSSFDDIQIIGIYKHQSGTTEVLNSEIYNSLAVINTTELLTTFYNTPKVTLDHGVTTNNVYHQGNLTIATLMGNTAIGDSDEPVYWNGTSFVKAGAYPTKSSWNYDDVYLKLVGGTLTGDLTIKSNSGDSPKLIFQRGTLTDSLDDWRIFDTGGNLKFQHTTGSTTTWKDYVVFSATAGTVTINGSTVWHSGNFTPSDYRNNIVDLRTNPQTFNPSYLKDIVFISEADYTTLVSNGSITKNSITHTYNTSNWYVIEDKVPTYAERAGNADYASYANLINMDFNSMGSWTKLTFASQNVSPTALHTSTNLQVKSNKGYLYLGSEGAGNLSDDYMNSSTYKGAILLGSTDVLMCVDSQDNLRFGNYSGGAMSFNIDAPVNIEFYNEYEGDWAYISAYLNWSYVTDKPDYITWGVTNGTTTSGSSYSLSNNSWTPTITLPSTAGSYILQIKSGKSTHTGVFSIGSDDNVKDEINLHLHGSGPRIYARTNNTTLELSKNADAASATTVVIKYRRLI